MTRTLSCKTCNGEFATRRPNQVYCSPACRDGKRWAAGKLKTVVRGYGAEHRSARAAAAAAHHPDDPCARCGHALGPMGPHLHYDHNGDRTGYLGFSHGGHRCAQCGKRCNVSAGARDGNLKRRERLLGPRPRRDWYA